jgi:hypothetical protein
LAPEFQQDHEREYHDHGSVNPNNYLGINAAAGPALNVNTENG